MVRKSKQAGGNFPLTHYERTKKFASSEYGTTQRRLAGHSQYQLGDCALSLTTLRQEQTQHDDEDGKTKSTESSAKGKYVTTTALCSPSGYLYSQGAIVEYLLSKTQELKEEQIEYEKWKTRAEEASATKEEVAKKKRVADFQDSQRIVPSASDKRFKLDSEKEKARGDLKRTSYWLASSQPQVATSAEDGEGGSGTTVSNSIRKPPPERPASPHSQEPLRRKDLWEVELRWEEPIVEADSDAGVGESQRRPKMQSQLVCAVSDKALKAQDITAYWVDKKRPGKIVLSSVYDDLIANEKRCPITDKRVKYTRSLQTGGTSFATSGQTVQVQQYRPTIT